MPLSSGHIDQDATSEQPDGKPTDNSPGAGLRCGLPPQEVPPPLETHHHLTEQGIPSSQGPSDRPKRLPSNSNPAPSCTRSYANTHRMGSAPALPTRRPKYDGVKKGNIPVHPRSSAAERTPPPPGPRPTLMVGRQGTSSLTRHQKYLWTSMLSASPHFHRFR